MLRVRTALADVDLVLGRIRMATAKSASTCEIDVRRKLRDLKRGRERRRSVLDLRLEIFRSDGLVV
jgi:hypothetical protein